MKINNLKPRFYPAFYRPFALTSIATGAVLISACSQSDTPHIDMCQRIADNLTPATISSWDENRKVEDDDYGNLIVELNFTDSDNNKYNAACTYATSGKSYAASPKSVVLNGQKVPFKDLLAAAGKSSGKIIKDGAEEAAEKSAQLAADAKEKAGELADQASELADVAGDKASELADQAKSLAGDATQRASELASQASEKAGDLAEQAADMAGEAGDKARATALEATKSLQEKLEK